MRAMGEWAEHTKEMSDEGIKRSMKKKCPEGWYEMFRVRKGEKTKRQDHETKGENSTKHEKQWHG